MTRWLLALGFVLLCVFCLMRHAPGIRDDLRAEALAALTKAGIADAGAELDGCRVRLAGSAATADALAAAQGAVDALPWVCGVDDRLTLASSPPTWAEGVPRGGERP